MMRAIAILLSVAGLSACGEAPDQAPLTEGNAETALPSAQPEGTAAQNAAPSGGDAQPGSPIPAEYQGVWDYVQGTCALESDLRMEISGDEIMFYESIGIVTDAQVDEGGLILTLAMEGEGDTWIQKTQLTLSDDGATLEPQTLDEGFVSEPLPRKRCPASQPG